LSHVTEGFRYTVPKKTNKRAVAPQLTRLPMHVFVPIQKPEKFWTAPEEKEALKYACSTPRKVFVSTRSMSKNGKWVCEGQELVKTL
jgi:hypothetical protein